MSQPSLTLRGRLGGQALQFGLDEGEHVLGRASTCDVRLDEPSVSRRHARLRIRGATVELEDLGSSNGTRHNGLPLSGPVMLNHGDQVDLGNVILTVDGGRSTTQMFRDQTDIKAGIEVSVDEVRRTRPDVADKKAYLFRILAEAGELLTRPLEPEELFDPLLELVEQALEPERIFLLLKEEDGEELKVMASRVRTGGPGGMILSQTLVSQVMDQRKAFLTEDASNDQRLLGGESIVSSGTHSAMAAPLFDNEKVIGLLYADTSDLTVRYTRDELKAFVLLANVVAVAITHARMHALEEERRRLRTELDAARLIMSRLLPRELPLVPGLGISAHLDACEEVAGDLYDARSLPDGRVLLVVGDVSGKGLPAALLVAALLPAIRVVAEECNDLGRLATRINAELFVSTDALRFATLFIGLLDPATGHMEFVNAGHNPPLLVQKGELELLNAVGPPVGMMPDTDYPITQCVLPEGSRLVFYSDGLTEAMNKEEDMYGDERLQTLLAHCPGCSLDDLQTRLLEDLAEFTGGAPQSDDMTLLLVERKAEAS